MTQTPSPSPFPVPDPDPADALIARAVAACARVRDAARNRTAGAVQYLRDVRAAGRALALVERSDGGRLRKNAVGSLTSYQRALEDAGISRPTAWEWRRVAAISDAEFEHFLEERRNGGALSRKALLLACAPAAPSPTVRTITLRMADPDTFRHQLASLKAATFADSETAALLAIVNRAYHHWLAEQIAPAPRTS